MSKTLRTFLLALSAALSVLILLLGWAGEHLGSPLFWFAWGFVSAYPLWQLAVAVFLTRITRHE